MKPELVGRCPMCWEKHGQACPPHETTVRGVAWYREYIADLEAEVESLRGMIGRIATAFRPNHGGQSHGEETVAEPFAGRPDEDRQG